MGDPDRRPATGAYLSRRSKWILWMAGLAMVVTLVPSVVVEGDTTWLLVGTSEILECLAREQWGRCEGAHQWPLLQYLPALPLAALGTPLLRIGDLLAYLSIASFTGLLVVTWRCVAQRSEATATLALIVLGSGELVYYVNRSFSEMLAAFLGVCLVAACLRGRGPGQVALWAFLTSLSKESSFPFLAVLGGVCLLVRDPTGGSAWIRLGTEHGRALGLAGGLCLGVVATAALNLFRFGVPYNVKYLHYAGWAGPTSTQLEHLAALWVAPNVGFIFFWPLFVLVLAAIPTVLWRERAPRHDWLSLGGALFLLALLSVFLARWWASYGWWAWGSRLMMPWVPPLLLLLTWSYARHLERGMARLLRSGPPAAAALTTAVVILGLPHLTSAFRTEEIITTTFIVPGVCPLPDTPSSSALHFDCVRDGAWVNPSPLLLAYELALDERLLVPVSAYSILMASACAHLWRTALSAFPR